MLMIYFDYTSIGIFYLHFKKEILDNSKLKNYSAGYMFMYVKWT